MKRVKTPVDMDLSFSAFQSAVELYAKEFKELPNKLVAGPADIFLEKFKVFAKEELSIPLDIEVKIGIPECHWEVQGTKGIVYSVGA